MNDNQQIQAVYSCDGCSKPFPASGVKRHCLDNNRGIRMLCVLCPECNHYQYSNKERIGLFPLLADYEKLLNTGGLNIEPKEIRTREFERHEAEEIGFQQEQIKNRQQQLDQSLFGCDKCQQPIPFGEEKEYFLARYKPNTSMVSDMKWFLLCSPCEKPLNKDLVPNTTFSQNVERTPTFIKYQEYKESLRGQSNPLARWERQVEEERQSILKKEQKKLGF